MLGVPLLVGAERSGVLHVGTLVPHEFTKRDIELLQLVADRVALAIERARLHQETVRLDQLKPNFVAIASHELRTPATSVYGVLTTLAEHGDNLSEELRGSSSGRASSRGSVSTAARGAARPFASRLARRSRRSEAARARQRPRVRSSPTRSREARRSRSTFPTTLAVVADRLVIDRVVSNLLINAARYGAPADHALRSRSDIGTCASPSRTAVPAFPTTCVRGSSSDSRARTRPSAAGSVSRSPAPMRAHTAVTSSTSQRDRRRTLRVDPASAELSKASQRRRARTRRAAISVPATVSTSFTAFEPRSFDSPLARSSIVTGTSRSRRPLP